MRAGLDLLAGLACDEIWCLGDLVGSPGSAETIALAVASCDVVLAGNHDLLASGRLPESYLPTHGRERIENIRNELSVEEMTTLRDLPTQALNGELQGAHAGLDHVTDHVEDRFDADNQLALADRRYLALGHSHKAFCFTAEGAWIVEPDQLVQIGDNALVSPGSVRRTERNGTVCVLDTQAAACEWHRILPLADPLHPAVEDVVTP